MNIPRKWQSIILLAAFLAAITVLPGETKADYSASPATYYQLGEGRNMFCRPAKNGIICFSPVVGFMTRCDKPETPEKLDLKTCDTGMKYDPIGLMEKGDPA